ncbi:GIY-YIG nuclease family protein [Seohaeicola saemankumensis]|uniref:GIY-YIG nuclease family protein n=1 Tax=Seohaeicola saemankumensis TaxID=481181 RepID=UPI001E521CDB|nr:GIY-YIG nuclease family protein [Seohaeicola saemankumensis]MCD1624551.1 GIY-YIG nuclease family protein [Seohaeicola saemankumensis]
MSVQGRSLELFFIDGRPDGMLTAEVFNWTGHVLRVPRTQIMEGLARSETSYTGVYVLIGENEGEPLAYIGEAEDMRSRIRDHVVKKGWWEYAILITSASNNLHKAHVKYLESRLVEIAKEVATIPLENGNTPPRSSLSEAAISNMEGFLETLMMVLPAIRVDMFLKKTRSPSLLKQEQEAPLDRNVFEFNMPRQGLKAIAVLEAGELIVQAGSQARSSWVGDRNSNTHYFKLYDELVTSGILVLNEDHRIFASNYAFSSPSAAAAIVSGRSANGRTSWVFKSTGQTYAEWEEALVEASQGRVE